MQRDISFAPSYGHELSAYFTAWYMIFVPEDLVTVPIKSRGAETIF
jgi:hypothetical protein